MELARETLQQHWLPFTSNREFKREPRLFVRASDMYYRSQTGQKILDGSSGLFTTAAGHCRVEIAKAVGEQVSVLDFTSSFMRGHPAPDGATEFFHGHTHSAHPVACAAGLPILRNCENEALFAKGRELSP